MSRRFSADNSVINHNIVAGTDLTGAYTLLIVLRRRAVGAYAALLCNHTSGGAAKLTLEFETGNKLEIYNGVSAKLSTTTYSSTTDWLMIGVAKAAGNTAPSFFVRNLTTSTSIGTETPTAHSDAATCSGGQVRIGEVGGVDDANMNVAVAAQWKDIALTRAQFDECWVNNRTSDIWNCTAGRPTALWEYNQGTAGASVPDLAGLGATWVSTTNTTVDGATDPPSWTYDGVGGAAAAVVVPSLDPQIQWVDDFGPGDEYGPNPFQDDFPPLLAVPAAPAATTVKSLAALGVG